MSVVQQNIFFLSTFKGNFSKVHPQPVKPKFVEMSPKHHFGVENERSPWKSCILFYFKEMQQTSYPLMSISLSSFKFAMECDARLKHLHFAFKVEYSMLKRDSPEQRTRTDNQNQINFKLSFL